ncbi:MAG TPA: maleylpyruvate isomerase N-terminal domain-containing protein [Mycobacteriales bacterium]|nr:maleylpyruvate isomerase N-terminal domain-containing protein [Mycobacteriales bacterium]
MTNPRRYAVDSPDVDRALSEMVRLLGPHTDSARWDRPAGSLTWDCRTTAAHVAHDLMAYAGQLAAGPPAGYLPFDLLVRESARPRELLDIVLAAGRLLSTVVAACDPQVRAWHWGPVDPGGFAALGVNETLVHTYDMAQGLELPWSPPADLCAAVLARLFPQAPQGDPARVLLWCTGRARLGERAPVTSWTPRAALPQ